MRTWNACVPRLWGRPRLKLCMILWGSLAAVPFVICEMLRKFYTSLQFHIKKYDKNILQGDLQEVGPNLYVLCIPHKTTAFFDVICASLTARVSLRPILLHYACRTLHWNENRIHQKNKFSGIWNICSIHDEQPPHSTSRREWYSGRIFLQKRHLVQQYCKIFPWSIPYGWNLNTQLVVGISQRLSSSFMNKFHTLSTSSILIGGRADLDLWATSPCPWNQWNQPLWQIAEAAGDLCSFTYHSSTIMRDSNWNIFHTFCFLLQWPRHLGNIFLTDIAVRFILPFSSSDYCLIIGSK